MFELGLTKIFRILAFCDSGCLLGSSQSFVTIFTYSSYSSPVLRKSKPERVETGIIA